MVMVMMALKEIINRFRLLLFSSTLIMGIILVVLFWRFAGIDQQLFRMIIALDLFGGVFGLAFFACIYAAFTVCLIPTLPMNVLAGFIWGGWAGGLISCVAVTLGSWVSFYLSRSVLCGHVDKMTKPDWFERVEWEINENAWSYLVFIRMNPIFPTGPINYLLGLTKIGNVRYVVCTFLPLLMPSLAFSFIGSFLNEFDYLEALGSDYSFVMVLMGGVAIIFLSVVSWKRFKRGKPERK